MTTKEQTEICGRLGKFLQSLASLAVDAQDEVGEPETLLDTIEMMQGDLERITEMAVALAKG